MEPDYPQKLAFVGDSATAEAASLVGLHIGLVGNEPNLFDWWMPGLLSGIHGAN
jgi:hypothetical protein